jgi:hypothetical protein
VNISALAMQLKADTSLAISGLAITANNAPIV